MRPKTLLALALAVIGLASFIRFFEHTIPSTDDRRELDKRVLPIESAELRAVVIDMGEQRARLERAVSIEGDASEEWQLVEPLVGRADKGKVDELLRELTELEKRRTLEAIDRAAVGLEAPRLQLGVEGAERKWTLTLGSELPASGDVVLSVDNREFYVVSGRIVDLVEENPGDWRAREILAVPTDEIERLTITTEYGELVLVREEKQFVLEAPVRDEASMDEVSELLRAVGDLSIRDFLDDPPPRADLGLAPAERVLELELGGHAEPLVIEIGATTDEGIGARYAATANQVFTVETDLLELVDRPPVIWQSTDWTRFQTWEIEEISIEQERKGALLQRRDGEWFLDDESVPYAAARDVIDKIVDLGETSVMSRDAGTALGSDTVLSLELRADGEVERLSLRGSDGEGFIALREGREAALAVSEESGSGLLSAVAELRSAAAGDEDRQVQESLPQP